MAAFTSKVTFHKGSCQEKTFVVALVQHGENFIVIVETTPFHPRDYRFCDQPQDRGYIEDVQGKRYPLADVVFVGISPEGIFSVDEEIPVKKNEPGWYFCVGHVIHGDRPTLSSKSPITLQVDETNRSALSRAHSAAHMMALSLNRTLAPLWLEESPCPDALDAPDFDHVTLESSSVSPMHCRDVYRIGKSLRKKGFAGDSLKADLKRHEDELNALIEKWLLEDVPVVVRADGDDLTSFRSFCTRIEGRSVEIPCGGTHVRSLREIGNVLVRLSMPDDTTLQADTFVREGKSVNVRFADAVARITEIESTTEVT